MSRSITVGADPSDAAGKFSVPSGIGDVKASGHLSNQVQVTGRMDGKTMDGKPVAAPEGQTNGPSPAPSGDTVSTAHGPATVHRTLTGDTLLTLPNGLQMSWAEAQAAGVIAEGGPQVKPKADPQSDPQSTDDNDTPALPTVDAAELESHASEINAAGSAFEAAGFDAADALQQAVTDFATDGSLSEDLSAALIDRFGDDGAQTVVDNANTHIGMRTLDAAKAAGINLQDADTVRSLGAMIDGADPAVLASALRGQTGPLQALIANFARSHRS